ncbi:MAG TPA: toll/interleukin-1 receptor domain-containing protein [Allosphingosinicella sp.]|nr:toll/interleukin-1 receptor domain-containing protein [Allosphingosinicella sp.]
MVDVFISYSRANRDIVCRLADAIGRLGYVVWWDEELPAHLSYGEVITAKIVEARATLVVWSAESAASEWVRAEADMARNQKKLIQTSIDDCPPPLPFNQIQYAAIGDWAGEDDHPGWRKAKASLAALCGPAPVEAIEPAPIAVPAAKLPPAAVYRPPQRPARSRSRAHRLAGVTIAASLAVILTVGGLVLLKGPPSAQASAAPAPAASPAPAQAPAPAITPPKTVTVDLPVGSGDEAAESGEVEPAEEAPETGSDY